MIRRPASTILVPGLVLLALAACRQTPGGQASPAPASARPTAGPVPSQPPPTDPRTLRFHKVDMLIAQWDVAQSSTRTDQADALFQQIRVEVDAGFPDFVAAARGDQGMRMQYLAVGALGFSARPQATTALIEQLAGTDPQLVGNALIALKLRADPDTPLPPILRMVTANAPAPRRYAPLAVANIAEARWRTGRGMDPAMQRAATHVLSGVVADRDPYVRLHVAKALGALRGPGTYDLLMILMKDEEIRIRLAAAAGLERVGDPGGFPEVVRLLADAPDDLKPTVRDLLASYGGRLQGEPLDPQEVASLGVSPQSWQRWFGEFAALHGLHVEEGAAPGRPPGAGSFPPAQPAGPGGVSPYPPAEGPPAGAAPSPLEGPLPAPGVRTAPKPPTAPVPPPPPPPSR